VALEVLTRVEADAAYASLLLDAALRRAGLAEGDAALCTELTYGTLRWRGRLDRFLRAHCHRPLEGLEPVVRNALRLGAYQLLFLDRVPPYAAVAETVEAVKRPARAAAGLVNAVLRALVRSGARPEPPDWGRASPAELAAWWSHPAWLLARWRARYGDAGAWALMEADNAPAPLSVAPNTARADPADLPRAIGALGLAAEASRWTPGFVRVKDGAALLRSPLVQAGACVPMDEASGLVVHCLDPRPGERILDACMGGGLKAALVWMRMGGRGCLVAGDPAARSFRRAAEVLARLGLAGIRLVRMDARQAARVLRPTFDRVLLDAPCSGLGTLRRHPEIRWQRGPEQLAALAALQAALLDGVAPCVREGGRLVYAVCSTEPEEGEAVIAGFLARHLAFRPVEPAEVDPALAPLRAPDGALRTFPHRHGTDGFYIAVLARRTGAP
jgi:16S rRNA (cytosine967-C5)-methyltransferase